jgi:hypothetical protein
MSLGLEKYCRRLQNYSQRGCRLKIQVFWEKFEDILCNFTTPSPEPKQPKKSELLKP